MNRRTLLALAPAALAALPMPALAQPALSDENQALLDRARAYLEGLRSVRGRFNQVDSGGRRSSGAFSLKRPNRCRFDYDAPSGLIVAADGSRVQMWDRRLHTFNAVMIGATPLDLFLGDRIRFDRGQVQRVTRGPDGFTVAARGGRQGSVELNFGDDPLVLRGWTAVDQAGRRTRVTLSGLAPASLPDSLFRLTPPASDRHERPQAR